MDIEEKVVNTRNRVDSAQDNDYWITLVNTALNPVHDHLVYDALL